MSSKLGPGEACDIRWAGEEGRACGQTKLREDSRILSENSDS